MLLLVRSLPVKQSLHQVRPLVLATDVLEPFPLFAVFLYTLPGPPQQLRLGPSHAPPGLDILAPVLRERTDILQVLDESILVVLVRLALRDESVSDIVGIEPFMPESVFALHELFEHPLSSRKNGRVCDSVREQETLGNVRRAVGHQYWQTNERKRSRRDPGSKAEDMLIYGKDVAQVCDEGGSGGGVERGLRVNCEHARVWGAEEGDTELVSRP